MHATPCGKGSGILKSTVLRRYWSCRVQAIPELVRSSSAVEGDEQRVEGGNHLPACGMGRTGSPTV